MKKINLLDFHNNNNNNPYELIELNNDKCNSFLVDEIFDFEKKLNYIYNIRSKEAYNNFLSRSENVSLHIYQSAMFYKKYGLELYPFDFQCLFFLNHIKDIKTKYFIQSTLTFDSIYQMYTVFVDYYENEKDFKEEVISSICVFINSNKMLSEKVCEKIGEIFIFDKWFSAISLETYFFNSSKDSNKNKDFEITPKSSKKLLSFASYKLAKKFEDLVQWNSNYEYDSEKYFAKTIDPNFNFVYIKHIEKNVIQAKKEDIKNKTKKVDSIPLEVDDHVFVDEDNNDISNETVVENQSNDKNEDNKNIFDINEKIKKDNDQRIKDAFEQVIGLEEAKKTVIEKLIWPIQYPDTYKKYNKSLGGGLLMYGPPGNGKTHFARMVAKAIDAHLIVASIADIESSSVGDAEQNIKEIFSEAKNHKRTIIFFDEFESIGGKRTKDRTGYVAANFIVPELLNQMGGFDNSQHNILVIAATNRPWDIDSALLRSGRFETKIHVRLPDYQERKDFFILKLKSLPILLEKIDYEELSLLTEKWNGADIDGAIEKIKDFCIEKEVNGIVEYKLSQKDIIEILNNFKPSVFEEDLEQLAEFDKKFGFKSKPYKKDKKS